MAPKHRNVKACSAPSIKAASRYLDNWSHYRSLSDSKVQENLMLLGSMDDVRRKWLKTQSENSTLHDQVRQLESRNNALSSENSEIKNRLLHCQNELAALVNTTSNQKNELAEWRKKFEIVRAALKDDAVAAEELGKIFGSDNNNGSRLLGDMNHSNTTGSSHNNNYNNFRLRSRLEPILDDEKENSGSETLSDIDYDKTAESLDEMYEHVSFRRGSKRRSVSVAPDIKYSTEGPTDVVEPSEKKPRNERNELITHTTIKVDMTGQTKPTATVRISGKMNRSSSESDIRARMRPTVPRGGAIASSSTDLRSPNPSWTNGKPIECRTHRVTDVRPLTGSCVVCRKYFVGTPALRCLLCQIDFHRQCQHRTPMPCIPKVNTPKPGSKNRATLKQYCPQNHPMVPPILIRCVLALEKQHLDYEGIYRIPGSASEIEKLYTDLLNNKTNSLQLTGPDVITSCIKKFLRELRDSLLPASSYQDFISAIALDKTPQDMIDCVLDLPAPNRDTLAFFMRHLQKVATHSAINKMPQDNLARVLGPTIVGYAFVVNSASGVDNVSLDQYKIVKGLLKLPAEFWDRIIMCNMSAILAEEARSPGSQSQYLTMTPSRPVPNRAFGTPRNVMDTPKSILGRHENGGAVDSSPLIQPISLPGRRKVQLSNLC
uniref:Rho-GAP domain-containing protein n=1 Tax=Panagrellus redivivus TaxID=6233 RepID=A0A7E4WAE3_PANRE